MTEKLSESYELFDCPLFEVGDMLSSTGNKLFNYEVVSLSIYSGHQVLELKPHDLIEPKRTGSYENFVVVNDPCEQKLSKVGVK